MTDLNEDFKRDIVKTIKNNFNVKDIILFGSYAYGTPNENSDLDLLVILNEKGYLKDWMERIDLKVGIKKALKGINRKFPIELLLYTDDEWNKLLTLNSCFYDEINEKGIRLT